MAIKIKFDLVGNPELPTIILANRNGNMLGQLKVNADSVELVDNLNDASEISFTINKYTDDKLTPLWEKVVDFKLIYCKEWDAWFEIKVELDEETETVKTVFCTQLGQAELSQIMLYNIEINTEEDIERDDYKISILYDLDHPEVSILNRILKDKAPHYSVAYVSPTIAKIQRSFSFDGISILDAFQEISEEIGCLFRFYAGIDENGKLQRKISVFDLQQYCNDCGRRGEYIDKCPKCGSTNIANGYGDDTLIFVTADELASEGIELVTDTDSVKNCFKLEGGDDLMTATIRNCNPNGTDYIWYFSDATKEDMSTNLVDKLNSYDNLYKNYYNNREFKLDTNLVDKYNALVEKYEGFYNTESTCINCDYKADFEGNCPQCGSSNILTGKNLQSIPNIIKGYSSLMNAYYNTIDLALYLESSLMPSIEMSDTSAQEQANLLTSSSLSAVAINTQNAEAISLATANSAVLSMAKIIVKSTYKVEVKTSTLSDDKIWEGNFIVTNYSDKNDTAESQTVRVVVNNDTETFVKQKLEKVLNKEDTDDYSISGLFEKDYDDFCVGLKKYALNPLKSFYDACDACLNILIDQGVGNKDEKPDLYEKLYEPYYKKSSAISDEIKIREDEIAIIEGVYDKTDEENPELITKGLQQYIEECINEIQDALDFEQYLGEELWLEFCAYRREDTYSNDNYISDGLNNAELFKKAEEFYEVAENEIYKSAELQHSISTTLNNLLAIDKFKPLVDSFNVGNWIRVQVDDRIFKLRLLEYKINFDSFESVSVEFSDVAKIKNGITDVESVLSQASSMATNYSSVQRQADKGSKAKGTLEQWISDGLNSAIVQIRNNDSEDVTFDKNGLLCRSYDEVTSTYSPEQLRITHNIMAYTDDEWKTVRQAIGKHKYKYYDGNANKFVDEIGYGMNADFVTAGVVSGSQIIGGNIYSDNYSVTDKTGSYLNLRDGTFNFGGGKITFNGTELLINPDNDIGVTESDVTRITNSLISTAEIDAGQITTGKLSAERINTTGLIAENISADIIEGITISGGTISGGSLLIGNKSGDYAEITDKGVLNCYGANITGKIIATEGEIGGCKISNNQLQIDGGNIVTGTISADRIDATNLTVNGAKVTGELTAARISASKITAGENNEEITFNGAFTAPSATIAGSITATSGKIGTWEIVSADASGNEDGLGLLGSAFYSSTLGNGGYYGIGFDCRKAAFTSSNPWNVLAIGQFTPNNSGESETQKGLLGGWNTAAFRVQSDGTVYAKSINIGDKNNGIFGFEDTTFQTWGHISFANFTKNQFQWEHGDIIYDGEIEKSEYEVFVNEAGITVIHNISEFDSETRSKTWWELLA